MRETNQKMFGTIKTFAECSGLSQYEIRKRIKSGRLPYITSGMKYLINIPAALDQINSESLQERMQ